MPDPDRPSGAPLSDRDADLLSERFTASWDDPELERTPSPEAPRTDPPPVAPPPPVAFNPSKPKATLLGIAPIVSIGPSGTSSKPPSIAPAPAERVDPAVTARMPAVTMPKAQATATATPLPGPSRPSASAAPAASTSTAPAPPPTPSSPESSSVAQGLTTPSKPYVPKDDASTPAVVISEGIAADRARAERARIAQTLPAQTRSSPLAAAVQLGLESPAPSPVASSALDDTYPPLRARKSKLPLLLGGAALTGLAAFVVLQLSNGGASAPAAPPTQALPAQAPVPLAPRAGETAPTSDGAARTSPPSPVADVAEHPPPAPPPLEAEPPSAAPKKAAAARPRKPAPAPAPKRAPSKAEPKAVAPPPAPEPGPKPAKGVIVRETPF